ncbi:MAG: hypothetical protein K2O10_01015 [Muribaculaceae bacterium]|nr:hypothetical protein [Muribaculaceae bacterium]
MKTYRLNMPVGELSPAVDACLATDRQPSPTVVDVSLIPDSALVTRGRPLFLPDFVAGGGWRLCVAPMFRIGRLGKFIEPRFAHRYVDGVGVCATLLPGGAGGVQTLEAAFDGSLVIGQFAPVESDSFSTSTIEIEAFGRHTAVGCGHIRLHDIIALLSRCSTLRTGDIVIPGLLPTLESEPQIGMEVNATASVVTAPGADTPRVAIPPLCFRVK